LVGVNQAGRGRYLFAIGIVVGLFVSGVVVPFAFGKRPSSRYATAGGGQRTPSAGASTAAVSGTGSQTPGLTGGAATGRDSGESQAPGTDGGSVTGAVPSGGDIKVGVALLDLRAVKAIGLGGTLTVDPAKAESYYRFYFDELNRSGGVRGRKVVPYFTTFDPTDQTTGRRACLTLTEDDQVFAAIIEPGLFGDPILCFTEEHHVPTFEYSAEPDEWYRRSQGLLFTPGMSGSRALRSLVAVLDANGALKGKKIGIVSTDSPTEKLPVDESLLPALQASGYSVAYRSTISQNTDQQPSQIPVEIGQMRSHGVDYIVWVSNALVLAQWSQTANSQGYNPPYAMTDINSASNDFTVQTVPSSTTAIAVTSIRDGEQHANIPESPKEAGCISRFEQGTGTTLERGSADYQTVLDACGNVEMFAAGATNAGDSLSADTFSQAMQNLGAWEFPHIAPGAYAPGKFDLADEVRTKVFDKGCTCWMPQGDFQPGAPSSQ
jgi:hypothetical protein